MTSHILEIAGNLSAAWIAGSLIGLERSHNGRAAGFRTHALVALAAAGVMIISFEPELIPGAFGLAPPRLDPTRLAQGVMTGVGFLGAGVIFKEGVSVQGLTTAACVWTTAAIGLLFGVGLWVPGVLLSAAVMLTLVAFRWLENVLPEHIYALAMLRFAAAEAPSQEALAGMFDRRAATFADISTALIRDGTVLEYRGSLKTHNRFGLAGVSERLRRTPGVVEFDLARISK
ncbi:MAG TPA: MgtC/SapB family protein [Caulobacteraceae bacterium]